MATGLFALLDDIAALARLAAASMDDIAAGAAKASSKAVGVVIDDAAVTPQYVRGLSPARELPIIKKIAIGSIRNKLVFILPVALVLSEFLPALLTPLLMLGGTYLCFEGAEKIIEKLRPSKHVTKAPSVLRGEEAENRVVSSAVRTDFILSAEIMVISLNEVTDHTLWIRAAILFLVAIVITVAVYGVVGLLVKLDDIGRALTRRDSELSQKFGRADECDAEGHGDARGHWHRRHAVGRWPHHHRRDGRTWLHPDLGCHPPRDRTDLGRRPRLARRHLLLSDFWPGVGHDHRPDRPPLAVRARRLRRTHPR